MLTCCGDEFKGSGKLNTKEYDFIDFNQVEVNSGFKFNITRSDSYSIRITADDNLFDYIQVSQEGTVLRILLKPLLKTAWFVDITTLAEISMPHIVGVDTYGATHGTVSGFSSTENLDVRVSGASSLELVEMSAGDVNLDVSGASKVTGDLAAANMSLIVIGSSSIQLEGSAHDIVVNAYDASRVKLAAFAVNNANIKLYGASTGTVNLEGRLDANLDDASELEYIGEPTIGVINTSGGSTVSQK